MHTPAAAGTPAPISLLSYGAWQAEFGQASAWEHYNQYLQEFGYDLPFGQLPTVDALPAELVALPVLRGWVDDVLTRILRGATWMKDFKSEYPPVGASVYPIACLAYFDQTIIVAHGPVAFPQTAQLTPEKFLRGVALALPFWPGMFGITKPAEALAAMQELLYVEGTPVTVSLRPEYREEYFVDKLTQWANLAIQYALFGQQLYK